MTSNIDTRLLDMADYVSGAAPEGWYVNATAGQRDSFDVRLDPGYAANPDARPFVRVVLDDTTYRVQSMNQHGYMKGEATFNGDLAALVPSFVRDLLTAQF